MSRHDHASYAVATCFTEFLSTLGTPRQAIDFATAAQDDDLNAAAQTHYGKTFGRLQSEWQNWVRQRYRHGSSVTAPLATRDAGNRRKYD